VGNKGFEAPLEKDIDAFRAALIKNKVNAIVRESKGKDIHAACGQLAIRFL
jgi:23S rRNA (adenine2503-C2)-methyltransferase